jgi:hypothetical protein
VRASAAACWPRLCERHACFEPQDIGTAGGVRALKDYSTSPAGPGPTNVVAHAPGMSSFTCATRRPSWFNGRASGGEPSPGADVAGLSPVPVQMWRG